MSEMEERIIELEFRYMDQARLLEELNGVVIECNQRIARLEQENRLLREAVRSLEPERPESPDE